MMLNLKNVVKINGTKDKLIPPRGNTQMVLINEGGHFMVVDRAEEVSKLLNSKIAKAMN